MLFDVLQKCGLKILTGLTPNIVDLMARGGLVLDTVLTYIHTTATTYRNRAFDCNLPLDRVAANAECDPLIVVHQSLATYGVTSQLH